MLRAGHTYVILVILSKRKAFMRYRVLRPNNIFQPLVAGHMLKSNYKKVWRLSLSPDCPIGCSYETVL